VEDLHDDTKGKRPLWKVKTARQAISKFGTKGKQQSQTSLGAGKDIKNFIRVVSLQTSTIGVPPTPKSLSPTGPCLECLREMALGNSEIDTR